MICAACGYDSDKNPSETGYEFWRMTEVNFQFERQEFTDEKEIMNGNLVVCPKCFTMKIQETSTCTSQIEEGV